MLYSLTLTLTLTRLNISTVNIAETARASAKMRHTAIIEYDCFFAVEWRYFKSSTPP